MDDAERDGNYAREMLAEWTCAIMLAWVDLLCSEISRLLMLTEHLIVSQSTHDQIGSEEAHSFRGMNI
jgi:hypothetical protein